MAILVRDLVGRYTRRNRDDSFGGITSSTYIPNGLGYLAKRRCFNTRGTDPGQPVFALLFTFPRGCICRTKFGLGSSPFPLAKKRQEW